MSDPYRTATPKEDIVNTRVDSLEKTASRVTNVIIGLMVAIGVTATCLGANTLYFRGQKLQGACHSEVKVHPRVASASNLVCDHPDQEMRHTLTDKEIVIACTCHGERPEK